MKSLIFLCLVSITFFSCSKQQNIVPIETKIVEDHKTRHHYIKFKCTLGFGSGCWTYIGICHGRLEHNIGGLNVAEWKMYDIVEDVQIITCNSVKYLKFLVNGQIYQKAVDKNKLYIGAISIQEGLDSIVPSTYDVIVQDNYAYIQIS